ncbi:MAG: hypothetical protein HGA27_08380, partial [Peptococcaceae bacterium]|nr:hypothetical protein [Peptococcaceae bacterium]
MHLNLDSMIMIVYILGMFILGVYCVRYIKTFDDFFVAGRRLGFWLSIGTLMSIFVGGLAIAVSGMAYSMGLSALWLFIAYIVGFLILVKTFLVPLRRLEQYTIADIFEIRFGKNCRLVSSISIFFSWTFIFAAFVVAGARVLEVSLGWSFVIAIIATAGVFTIYTAIAGMWAVTMTDFVQFIILLVGFAILFPMAIYKVGGFSALFSQVPQANLSLIPVLPEGGLIAGLGVIWGIFMLTTPTTVVAPDMYLRIW